MFVIRGLTQMPGGPAGGFPLTQFAVGAGLGGSRPFVKDFLMAPDISIEPVPVAFSSPSSLLFLCGGLG